MIGTDCVFSRTVDIKYVGSSSYEGIPAARYVTDDNFLNKIGPEHNNDCYCVNRIPKAIVKANGCLYEGALDLSTCFGKCRSCGAHDSYHEK